MTATHLREALEPLLFELFDQAAQLQDEGNVPCLRAYLQRVTALQLAAKQHQLLGLSYVGMLVESGLTKLITLDRLVAPEECDALAAWPALVLGELMSPAMDEAAPWAVLHALRSQPWFPAISAANVALIERRLAEDAGKLAQAEEEPVHIAAELVAEPEPQSEAEPEAAQDTDPDMLMVDEVELEDGDEFGPEMDSDTIFDIGIGEAQAAAAPAVTAEELAMLSDALVALQADLATLVAPGLAPAERDGLFENHLEQLHNLVNAANLLGLAGFQQVLEVILINTAAMQAEPEALSDQLCTALQAWPTLAMAHLQAPGEPAPAQALAECVAGAEWPYPADTDSLPEWISAMTAVSVVRARPSQDRPVKALPEHMDLSVPADIDRKVLDSLLVELPPHAQEFSALVQRLSQGGTLDDMDQARRVAHTLKGAANTVGIKGVANLTHALEDILVAFGREERLPTCELVDMLLEASDCLEAMSEALVANAGTPPESLAVHQKVLDWANRIDRDGLPADQAELIDSVEPVTSVPMAPTTPTPAQEDIPLASNAPAAEEDAQAETYLRVPASLIDSLLKLAGENSIVTSQIQDRVTRLSDNINALRTGSRQFGQLSAELEQLVDVRGLAMLGGHTGELDALEMDQYNELHMLSRRIVESGADSREFSRSFERELASMRDLMAEKERLQLEIQRSIQRTRMVEVASISPRLQRTVRQAARVLNRSVDLRIQGEATMVDTQLLDRIIDPLMHLLRNAVDHGIESPDVRETLGKPATGTITLSFSTEGNNVAVRCEDDGCGLDLGAIRHRALSRGLIAPDAALSDAQVMRLIVLPGFSTREQTTQLSGRGIGMDVVQRAVVDLRGTLDMDSQSGQGSRFDLHFPVRMSTIQVMLSRSEHHLLGISVRGVEQILPAREEVGIDAQGGLSYALQGEQLNAIRLEKLMGLPHEALKQAGVMEVAMIVRDEFRQRLAIIVPELSDARTVVVKPFNPMMPHALGIDGATVLGDGSVATVIDLPDLLRDFTAGQMPGVDDAVVTSRHKLPLCLVVDDSVSVRRTMEQLMQDSGYEVVTARDGVDALGAVQLRAPDIVLVDLEMPRMNGLELTNALRNRSATKATPVVMITSRFTDKHRQLANDAGVNAFLTKPYSEDLLLNTIDGLLRSAA
ncbi:response regulator [Aquabacterium sp. CECT 9606]|uniref:hybrid sensor histidine kinase/response regulator n=1 Tax=Aquabacterium sp. CECT 9606 TaxID=2845822 RepID=UPI001E4134D2|nr:response regulator [Aquabacterium sp. CECT 9606]CAH0347946.1 Sensor histidine kinase RcsC [Aquabacterium sp. CECT 9606]